VDVVAIWFVRGVFILLVAFVAFQVATTFPEHIPVQPYLAAIIGAAGAGALVALELWLRKKPVLDRLAGPAVGLTLGLVSGYFLTNYVVKAWWPLPDQSDDIQIALREAVTTYLTIALSLVFGYFGLILGMARRPSPDELVERAFLRARERYQAPKILDTSTIIDGRIADVCASGFIEGTLVIPRFVLRELQNIADSADPLRRARGRRGLDMLNKIKEGKDIVDVEIYELELEEGEKVDTKLVQLAKRLEAKIITNDFNLNKVAQIEKVPVLNVNDLANAVKPAVLPDEQMIVRVMKEGKEPGQGIGYLDDGTMVVVDGGKSYMGKDIRVVVTSVLQTAAGKMIFAKLERVMSRR
jgi:uncharacterized protein YacL